MKVVSLHRYAVKGLSGDALSHVYVHSPGDTFPDDRRYALKTIVPPNHNRNRNRNHNRNHNHNLDFHDGEWRHKNEFLCAFTAPELLAQLQTSYAIHSYYPECEHSRAYPWDAPPSGGDGVNLDLDRRTTTAIVRRLLSIRDRWTGVSLVHPPLDLALEGDRRRLADFLSVYASQDVVCWVATRPTTATVTTTTMTSTTTTTPAGDGGETTTAAPLEVLQGNRCHTHQFGNTSSGYKQRGDTRTIHLIHRHTVQALAQKIGQDLNPLRFRPNIVLDEADDDDNNNNNNNTNESTARAFCEFDWIGKQLQVVPRTSPSSPSSLDESAPSPFTMTVLAKTVRCRGVSIDPYRLNEAPLDIPALLVHHFPHQGPYLGVYATIDVPGHLRLGDTLQVLN